jgi:glyoxylase-like metal-dependent hydrolase (beta-lactamase superfamily II)
MFSRRAFIARSSAAIAGASLFPADVFGRMGSAAGFTPLRNGVGTFTMQGGTMGYLATPSALVVIDTQYPAPAATALAGLRERSDRAVDVLVNTHHHGDHTSGNAVFSPNARQFVAHREAARLKRLATESRGEPEPEAYPTSTYAEALRIDLGDEVLSLRHFGPAHTSGDSVVSFENADVVHMGDLMFHQMPPFIDKVSGASIAGWIQTLETVHDLYTDDTIFIHGHAGPNYSVTGTRADLLGFRDFLSGLIDFVEAGMAAGKGVDQLAANDRLPDFPEHYLESWKDAIPNAIRATHQELTSTN